MRITQGNFTAEPRTNAQGFNSTRVTNNVTGASIYVVTEDLGAAIAWAAKLQWPENA